MHLMDCSCAPVLRFSLRRQMVPKDSAKFRTAFFREFCRSLRNDNVQPIVDRFGRGFDRLLEDT